MITAFILDDQDSNIIVLKSQLGKFFPGVVLCGTHTDPVSALPEIMDKKPDLLFLDIHMPGLDGFEFIQRLEGHIPAEIIFVTAYSEFALKAFEYQAAGYITKPVDATKLVLAVNKVIDRIYQRKTLSLLEERKPVQGFSEEKKLALSTQKGLVFVAPESIYYCESNGNYTLFHLQEGKQLLVSKQIGYFEQILPRQYFVRIHDRYIAGLKHIKAYQRGGGGILVLENGKELPVSVRRKEQLLKYFE